MFVREELIFDSTILAQVQEYADRYGLSLSSAFSLIAFFYFSGCSLKNSLDSTLNCPARDSKAERNKSFDLRVGVE